MSADPHAYALESRFRGDPLNGTEADHARAGSHFLAKAALYRTVDQFTCALVDG